MDAAIGTSGSTARKRLCSTRASVRSSYTRSNIKAIFSFGESNSSAHGYLVNADHFDAVAPIALYRTRLTRRGFNQPELMAKSDAARINVPVSDKLEVVCRTTDQVELSADTRRSNVAGAYAS